jgi:hypothetical protein
LLQAAYEECRRQARHGYEAYERRNEPLGTIRMIGSPGIQCLEAALIVAQANRDWKSLGGRIYT